MGTRRGGIWGWRANRAETLGRTDGPGVVRLDPSERTGSHGASTPDLAGAPGPPGWITRLPGWAQSTCEGVVRLWEAAGRPHRLDVLDVGADGGKVHRPLLRWADRAGVRIAITLLRRDPTACEHAARRFAGEPRVRVVQGDAQHLLPASTDIVTATLALHRLPAVQAPWTLLHWRQAARIGVVAVDLRRHPSALAGTTTPGRVLAPGGRLRHSAPPSAQRGFRDEDLVELRSYPGLEGLRYRWRPWFGCQITLGGDPPPCGS